MTTLEWYESKINDLKNFNLPLDSTMVAGKVLVFGYNTVHRTEYTSVFPCVLAINQTNEYLTGFNLHAVSPMIRQFMLTEVRSIWESYTTDKAQELVDTLYLLKKDGATNQFIRKWKISNFLSKYMEIPKSEWRTLYNLPTID